MKCLASPSIRSSSGSWKALGAADRTETDRQFVRRSPRAGRHPVRRRVGVPRRDGRRRRTRPFAGPASSPAAAPPGPTSDADGDVSLRVNSPSPLFVVATASFTRRSIVRSCAAAASACSATSRAATASETSTCVEIARSSTPAALTSASQVLLTNRSSSVWPWRMRYCGLDRPPRASTSAHAEVVTARSSGRTSSLMTASGSVAASTPHNSSSSWSKAHPDRMSYWQLPNGVRPWICRSRDSRARSPDTSSLVANPLRIRPSGPATGRTRMRNCPPWTGLVYSKSDGCPANAAR